MSSEVIKLKTNSSLKEALSKIYHKFSNTNSQLTVIIKKSSKDDDYKLNPFQRTQIKKNQDNVIHQHLDKQSQTKNLRKNKMKQLNQKQKEQKQNGNQSKKLQSLCNIMRIDESDRQKSQVLLKNKDFQNLNQSFNVCISTKLIFPNVQFTQRVDGKIIKSQKKNTNLKKKSTKLNKSTSPQITKNKFKQKKKKIQDNFGKMQVQLKEIIQNGQQERSNVQLKALKTSVINQNRKQQIPNSQAAIIFRKLPKKEIQKQNQQEYFEQLCSEVSSQESSSISAQQSVPQSLFVVQDKLNDAISYIKMNKIFQLEEYLYQFKTKYICMSDRVEIKWRLLMAHCKQYRKEYDRASILYQQVLQMAKGSPKSLLIQPAQIYHRLGICYTQIRKWNDGIQAFAQALKGFKKGEKNIKYAQCINNLGTLYLAAYQIEQAQQCFFLSYQIKTNQCSNPSKFISSLLNLYECNLMLHNYEQAEQVLKQVEKIAFMVRDNMMLSAGLQRRKGKLLFLKGELQQAAKLYLKAIQQVKRYPYCLEYAQLCSNLGVLKLQQQKLVQAKQLLQKALGILNFYYTRDSQQIKNIRNNLQLIEKIGQKQTSYQIINSSDAYSKKDCIPYCQNIEPHH